jgi:dTDP-4-amino-4,6-dideoxygalactose transaminase
MITTNDDALADKIRMFRDHGRSRTGEFECIGYNSRLDTIQALYLHRKLVDLDEAIEDRVANAQLYNELFAGSEIVTPAVPSDASHSFNYYTVRVRDRNHLKNYLQEKGIGAAIYYKEAMHETPALKGLGFKLGDFPVAEQACREVLTLPNWPGMKKKEIEFVAQVVAEFLANNNKNVVAPVS